SFRTKCPLTRSRKALPDCSHSKVRSREMYGLSMSGNCWPVSDPRFNRPSEGRLVTQSGNPSSYKAVIEANESGRPAVEKLEPFHPGLAVIVAVRGGHLKGALCTPHVPV